MSDSSDRRSLKRNADEPENDKYDLQCEICADEGRDELSTQICENCKKYLCDKCSKSDEFEHRKEAARAIGLQSDLDILQLKAEIGQSEKCPQHGSTIDRYCQQHGEFCCDVCISLKHRMCTKIATLHEISAGVKKTKEPNAVLSNMKTLIRLFKATISRREQDKQPIIEQRVENMNAIKAAREKMNKKFDELQDKVEKKLEQTNRKECGQIDSHIDKCNQVVKTLETALTRIDDAMKFKNDSDIFVTLKKMSYQLPDIQSILRSIQREEHIMRFRFRMNEKLRKMLDAVEEMGDIHVTTIMKGVGITVNKGVLSGDGEAVYLGKGKAPNVPELHAADEEKGKVRKRTSLSGPALHAGDYNIRQPRETDCCITSATFLANGDILLVDKSNQKLKLFNPQFRCLSSLLMTSGIWDVCMSGTKKYDAFVSVSLKSYIQQVAVGSRKLQFGTSFKTDGECWGLTWCNMGLAVIVNSLQGHLIQIMDAIGNVRKRIHFGRDGRSLFSEPLYVIATRNGRRLLVSDYSADSVICLDPQRGEAVFTYTDSDLYGPHGLTIDDKDCIYVSGHKSHNVHQITSTGQKMKMILTEEDGVAVPFGLTYSARMRSLLVTAWSDNVKMLKLT